jgi:hypothetical protein
MLFSYGFGFGYKACSFEDFDAPGADEDGLKPGWIRVEINLSRVLSLSGATPANGSPVRRLDGANAAFFGQGHGRRAAGARLYAVSNRTCSTLAATLIRNTVYLKRGVLALPVYFNLQPG